MVGIAEAIAILVSVAALCTGQSVAALLIAAGAVVLIANGILRRGL